MKNTILAAAAVLSLALSAGAGFAAERNANANANGITGSGGSSNVFNNCASILASPEGHSRADVEYCQAQQ